MIKVGFDISQLAHEGGVATYTKNLAENLSQIPELDMVYFYSSLRKPYKGKLKNVKKYHLPPTLFEVLFNRIHNITIERFIGSVDIFHSSDWVQPPSKALKVTTFHDVVALKYPQWSHPSIVAVHKRRLKIVEREVDQIIVVSESTKRDLMEVSNISQKKIIVIYEAASGNFTVKPKRDVVAFKKKFHLPDKFVLAIGGVGERRNLKRIREACQGYNLIIAGQDIHWLTLDELELLYNSASILLYPSLYEGFGLPILDAFLCGTPVITANVSSMPEVGGNGAIYVNPFDINDIKKKIKMVLEDKKLREDMIKKGFVQVKKFSWEKTAIETAKVYRGLIK